MKRGNPFSISFGKTPDKYIARLSQTHEILDDWESDNPASQVYMVSGVRGSGKTVLMTEICSALEETNDWIVINLNPDRDLLQSLAGKLYDIPGSKKLFQSARLNLSAFGLGVSIQSVPPISDIENALEKMLFQISKHGKRVLISIDEVSNTPQIRVFASAFQIFIRAKLPVFLLMTGLYENIYDLQNEKALTFLYRAPKLFLEPLNLSAVQAAYKSVFDISNDLAANMTRLTRGYPFAFQVLGYLYWKHGIGTSLDGILPEYDQYLEEYVYEKIWLELSDQDQKVLTCIVGNSITDISSLRRLLNFSPQLLYTYKKRLVRKGVLTETGHGQIQIILPRFEEFVCRRNGLML